MKNLILSLCLLVSTPAMISHAQPIPVTHRITEGAKVFIEPMDGFETYLSAAIIKKKVPLTIVDSKEKADYVIGGVSHVQPAGWAKTIFVSPTSHADASVTVKDVHTGNVIFAYAVDKLNSIRADQSTAEACAKHIKENIESGSGMKW